MSDRKNSGGRDRRPGDRKGPGKPGRPAAKKDSFRSAAPRKEKGYDLFDKDELAPPRFLEKRGSSGPKKGRDSFIDKGSKSFGDKKEFSGKRDSAKRDFKGKSDFGDKKEFGSKREYGPRKDFDGKKDFGSRKDFGDKKEFGGKRDFGAKKEFDTKREFKGEGKTRRPFSDEREEKPFKKPFKPKYDPEVKTRKSYKERKLALTGPEEKNEGDIRLNKFLANAGICSRREADELIAQGLVTVNNKVVTEMGYRVSKEDVVKYDGRKILPEPYVYILMNKPKDFITTTDDEKGRKTVMDLLADKIPQRVFPIGRLDRNTTGVLLLTNDGDVAQVMTHPSFNIKKVYHVVLDKKVNGSDLDKLVQGVDLEDGTVNADAVSYVESEDRRHVGVEIHSGKNRVVRRMFEHLGYEVEKLDRVSMGIFTKKDLPRGKWRHLNQSEVGFLMKLKAQL